MQFDPPHLSGTVNGCLAYTIWLCSPTRTLFTRLDFSATLGRPELCTVFNDIQLPVSAFCKRSHPKILRRVSHLTRFSSFRDLAGKPINRAIDIGHADGDASAALVGFEPVAPYFRRSFSLGRSIHFCSHHVRDPFKISRYAKRYLLPVAADHTAHLHLYYTISCNTILSTRIYCNGRLLDMVL